MQWLGEAISRLRRGERVVLATVLGGNGSSPRPAGSKMLMAEDAAWGSIGGGALERRALAEGRALLGGGAKRLRPAAAAGATAILLERLDGDDLPVLELVRRQFDAVGAMLVTPLDEPVAAKRSFALDRAPPWLLSALPVGVDAAVLPSASGALLVERLVDRRAPVWLFGAGHVGQALARALEPLPFHLTWVDDRPGLLPAPRNGLTPLLSTTPAEAVAQMPPGALAVIMSHSHALDFAIAEAALARGDLGFVGLIASAAKKAQCLRRCRAAGLDEARLAGLVAPIGLPGIRGREPAVIAASVAAQLLLVSEARAAAGAAAA